MAKAEPGGSDVGRLSLKKAAEMLGMDEDKVKILASQGRLKDAETQEGTRYDLDSVLSMQAENLIREMHEEAGDKLPKLRGKIDTLAMLQYQRGREGKQRAEHWEILERIEKLSAENGVYFERRIAKMEEMNDAAERRSAELQEMNNAAERRLEEMRALVEGRLRRMPGRESEETTG